MKAMIFAAGLGTRLYPLTQSMPKALVEIKGKPLIRHAIDYLADFGITEIVVNVHHYADQIISYLQGQNFRCNIIISDEREALLDTGGGIKKASPLFHDTDPIILYNVDILTTLNIDEMLRWHHEHGADITLAIRSEYRQRYLLLDKKMRVHGKGNGEMQEIHLPCIHPLNRYRFSGIHIISPNVFKAFPTETRFPIMEWYMNICAEYKIVGFPHSHDMWADVGRIEILKKLNEQ